MICSRILAVIVIQGHLKYAHFSAAEMRLPLFSETK